MLVKLSLCLLLLFVSHSISADEQQWRFDVSIDDHSIGVHTFKKSFSGPVETIISEASFKVSVLFVPVFKYEHTNSESWRENCLASINSQTKVNRQVFEVSSTVSAGRLSVQSNGNNATYNDCIQTFAYWNPSILQATNLLNAQTGELEEVSINYVEDNSLSIKGSRIATRQYRIDTNQGPINLWYRTKDMLWVGLTSQTPNGQSLRYSLTALPTTVTNHAT